MAAVEEIKLEKFNCWLQVNGAELRGCRIQHCGLSKGFGVFYYDPDPEGDGVLMVVPLDLAITPMRVLGDPLFGPVCGELYKQGGVDDRLLMMLFLTVERLRPNSTWKPYFDVLPSSFSNPLWFSDAELSELKGTTLYMATLLQKKSLQEVFDDKVKSLVMEILSHDSALGSRREVTFEDFLWANSIFWTRALNIPFPHSYVFPLSSLGGECFSHNNNDCGDNVHQRSEAVASTDEREQAETTISSAETVWVEGLVPGIDFCNHGLSATVTWEVDSTGFKTGVPSSMYLVSAEQNDSESEGEIQISYGNKGNEELLYLYGFVINDNPDDYLMVHYPLDALKNLPSPDLKAHLLRIQKAELRWLLPRSLLDHGFCSDKTNEDEDAKKNSLNLHYSYSWSGQRKAPSYLNKLVFPEDLLASLRTIAMSEPEISKVTSLLEELMGSDEKKQPTDKEVQAAIWEICGDSGALQMLVDLLLAKIMELEEGSGTEACDSELLKKFYGMNNSESNTGRCDDRTREERMNRNKFSCFVYRSGQKQLTRLFLKEAEHILNLCFTEQMSLSL